MAFASLLTEEQVNRTHEASLEILENVGLLVRYDKARAMFSKHGCKVDAESCNVKFPRKVVEKFRRMLPPTFTFRGRDPKYDRSIPRDGPIIVTGSSAPDIIDPVTGRERRARSDDIARIAENEPIDFIQLTYNIADREAEARLLPLALERGIAVIANRPFREGVLIQTFGSWPLPPVAAEIGAATWPQFLLKFVISHPAVTAAIPATRSSGHMAENMASMGGGVPDAATRTAMAKAVGDL